MLLVGVLFLWACDEAGPFGAHRLYALTGEHVPVSTESSRAYAVDLDDDGELDNQLGTALGVVTRFELGDVQNATDQAVAAHALELVLDTQFDDHGYGRVNTFVGSADAYDPTSPSQPPIPATVDGSYVNAYAGDLPAVIAPFGVVTPVVLHRAHVQLVAGPDSVAATIDGALDPDVVLVTLMAQWQGVVQAIVDRDCTGSGATCGCPSGSPGALAIDSFDPDRDCTITVDELANNPVVQGAISLDLKLDGKPMISFGFGIDAERVPD
jgi:hypothetical protein